MISTDTAAKARRNLLFISVIVSFYILADVQLTKLSILGNDIEPKNKLYIELFAWLIFGYYLYRYLVLIRWKQIKSKFNDTFVTQLRQYLKYGPFRNSLYEASQKSNIAGENEKEYFEKSINKMMYSNLKWNKSKKKYSIEITSADIALGSDNIVAYETGINVGIFKLCWIKVLGLLRYLRSAEFVEVTLPLMIAIVPIILWIKSLFCKL